MTSTNLTVPANKSQQIQQFIQSNLVKAIVVSTCLNLGLTGAATWSVWNTAQDLKTNVARQDSQQNLSSKLTYLDEVLTMSARMYVNTGVTSWDKRYTETVPVFDKVWAEFIRNIPPSQQLNTATANLFAIEDQAFKLAKQGKLQDAAALLSSPKYQQNKQIYAAEVATMIAKNKSAVDREVNDNQQADRKSVV